MFLNGKERRGGAHIGYSMLVGFVSIATISMVAASGREIKGLFSDSAESIAAGAALFPSIEDEEETPVIEDYTNVFAEPGQADPNCYVEGNQMSTGDPKWRGCGGMLIVTDDAMQASGSTFAALHGRSVPGGGNGTFSIDFEGKTYGFGKGDNNIFTGQLTILDGLFDYGSPTAGGFNEDISHWDTSNVTSMFGLFLNNIDFDQDISQWDTSKVTDMGGMFSRTASAGRGVNPDISGWDVSNVVTAGNGWRDPLYGMFNNNNTFNQDLSGWCVSHIASTPSYFASSTTAVWPTAKRPQWGQAC